VSKSRRLAGDRSCTALLIPDSSIAYFGEAQRASMTRLGDFLIACLLLAISLPVMIVVALAIKWESPGPILERQIRIGRGGRIYNSRKFRITFHDPEHGTPRWLQKQTQVGQFLRYSRIEYLPQLINVVRGEISIIQRDPGSRSFLD